jgi:hypothetical protein
LQPSHQQGREPRPAPKTAAKTDGAAAAQAAPAAVMVQRKREAIAELIERNAAFGVLALGGAPKLSEAQLAGPFEYKGLFQTKPATLYCARAKMDSFLIPTRPAAVVEFVSMPDGTVRLEGRAYTTKTPRQCLLAKYEPFPELERARQRRRQATGKTD